MSDSQTTADDFNDRLVDRVLAEAIGGERPPDLSESILQRVDDAQPETSSQSRGRRVMQSRRAWVTLLATAASLMGVVLWQGVDAVDETKIVLLDRSATQPSESMESSYTAVESASSDAPAAQQAKLRQQIEYLSKNQGVAAPRRLTESLPPSTRGQTESVSEPDAADVSSPITPEKPIMYVGNYGGFEESMEIVPSSPTAPVTPYGVRNGISDGSPFGFQSLEHRRWPEPNSQDRYEPIHENGFMKPVGEDALSTFSIDVDTASYSSVRQYLVDRRAMPPANSVRIEELVNYFEYGYKPPAADSEDPFAASLGCFACPWKPEHKLVRIGVKGREVAVDKRPLSNLVFLVDVSGSMNEPNKLPLVVSGLNAMVDRLGENDRVAIVVYAGSEGLVLPSTSGERRDEIRSALGRLTAGGSTAGGAGLRLAYEIAERNKITGGVNRVVLCTDGDFNVGMTGTEELARFVETRAKETNVYLTVLGFGRGNLNDAMLEQISGRGDGNYAYIDTEKEARRVLSQDLSKTLVTIAKDVKMQVEFNPAKVASYRLIGYENRVMAAEDFNNDAKDAGDIGAGHTVTALYEIVPVGVEAPAPPVDGLKYQPSAAVGDDAAHAEPTAESREPMASSNELLTLKVRYKQHEGGASKKLEFPLEESDKSVAEADADFRWAAAVAEFGMLLRNSSYAGDGTYDAVLELARGAIGDDPHGYRAEFLDLVRRAKELSGR